MRSQELTVTSFPFSKIWKSSFFSSGKNSPPFVASTSDQHEADLDLVLLLESHFLSGGPK